MKKIYTYLIFSFALLCSTSLIAQTNEKARETAVMIADRILKSTTYDFVDKKSGKTYISLKNVPLNKNVKVVGFRVNFRLILFENRTDVFFVRTSVRCFLIKLKDVDL